MARKKSVNPEKLVLVGGAKPQMRKRSAKSWTLAKEMTFLGVLAETCNVTRACEAAGVGVTSVYRRKKENAAFRRKWIMGVAIAYQQLELVLLERAFNGVEKAVTVRGGQVQAMREYSNQLGIALLKMHRETASEAEYEVTPGEIEEVRERLLKKLQRLEKRDGQCGAPE